MATEDAQKVLADEILQDAKRKAEDIQSAAKAEAGKILAQAKATAQSEAEKILAEHRARAGKRAAMTLQMVEQQVARGKLHARDTVIQSALEQAAVRLMEISGEAYKQDVVRLAAAAARQMPAGDLTVKVTAAPGANLDESSLASEIAAALQKEGKTVNLSVKVRSGPARGVVVESADGKLRWDNTFEERLRRLRPGLQRLTIPILFEEA
ncbi:MAG: V-type ATP synthase subunit E [Candidatus Brocadiia bacterium]